MIIKNKNLMKEIRGKFENVENCSVGGERIFFENAGGSLTLKKVVSTSSKFAALPDNQGRHNEGSNEVSRVIHAGKADLSDFLNTTSGQIFVGESGTELLFRLISEACLHTSNTGNLVGSTLEHPASRSASQRWTKIASLDYVEIIHNDETGLVSPTQYCEAVNCNTRVATIIHTSPITGMTLNLFEISKAIRKKSPNCYIIVDGIQHAPHGNINIDSYDIDGYVISPYKVFSRHGYGVAWISDRLAEIPHNSLSGAPKDSWELGTRDPGSYATFSDVVQYFNWLGEKVSNETTTRAKINAAGKAISEYEKHLTDLLLFGTGNLKGLSEYPEIYILGGTKNPARTGLVSFLINGIESSELVKYLETEGIRVHIRKNDHYSGNVLKPLVINDCVRVSICHYNTEDEVAKFLSTISNKLLSYTDINLNKDNTNT